MPTSQVSSIISLLRAVLDTRLSDSTCIPTTKIILLSALKVKIKTFFLWLNYNDYDYDTLLNLCLLLKGFEGNNCVGTETLIFANIPFVWYMREIFFFKGDIHYVKKSSFKKLFLSFFENNQIEISLFRQQ